MTITEHISNAQSTLFSFELLPPLKGENLQTIFNAIDPLLEFAPAYINVTYHREEVVYHKGKSGAFLPKVLRRRPGTVGIAAAIQHRYNIDVVPHVICGGFSKEDTEDALIDFDFLGINNLLAVRGDADKITGRFEPNPAGHPHAVDLIKQIVRMNNGHYNDENIESATPTKFCIGVAGYPEKHTEAPNMANDLMYLKAKVDAGAEYIVTQLFFDNKKYFSFVESCRKVGITVPIIPGLKPISVKEHMSLLPRVFNVDLPEDLVRELVICNDNKSARELGIEWTIQQAKELKQAGVPSIHFYTMGKSDNIARIARAVY
ncbi:methylenetetrahydrofolate reductase [NAD(P)H] [Williamwhitmania taraxaci]|uniref:Methylenetetrahydrofolate reductase n=1 Tax=Williamwhitmania taraxaci TaxID=1640674 RepID=A0A1G6Q988_9BACT|nr:methylenetetrahydrofolate reductase [NAD(P)H] [Williamwhitmania taraxaci]SDC89050.1 5,10-methylenetetrahydrofolate reductase (NAD(P)) [Williamwhitmania taraxaci]